MAALDDLKQAQRLNAAAAKQLSGGAYTCDLDR